MKKFRHKEEIIYKSNEIFVYCRFRPPSGDRNNNLFVFPLLNKVEVK